MQPGAQAGVQASAETGAATGVQPSTESTMQVRPHDMQFKPCRSADLFMGTQ